MPKIFQEQQRALLPRPPKASKRIPEAFGVEPNLMPGLTSLQQSRCSGAPESPPKTRLSTKGAAAECAELRGEPNCSVRVLTTQLTHKIMRQLNRLFLGFNLFRQKPCPSYTDGNQQEQPELHQNGPGSYLLRYLLSLIYGLTNGKLICAGARSQLRNTKREKRVRRANS